MTVSCFTGSHSQKHSNGICSLLLHLQNTVQKRCHSTAKSWESSCSPTAQPILVLSRKGRVRNPSATAKSQRTSKSGQFTLSHSRHGLQLQRFCEKGYNTPLWTSCCQSLDQVQPKYFHSPSSRRVCTDILQQLVPLLTHKVPLYFVDSKPFHFVLRYRKRHKLLLWLTTE